MRSRADTGSSGDCSALRLRACDHRALDRMSVLNQRAEERGDNTEEKHLKDACWVKRRQGGVDGSTQGPVIVRTDHNGVRCGGGRYRGKWEGRR